MKRSDLTQDVRIEIRRPISQKTSNFGPTSAREDEGQIEIDRRRNRERDRDDEGVGHAHVKKSSCLSRRLVEGGGWIDYLDLKLHTVLPRGQHVRIAVAGRVDDLKTHEMSVGLGHLGRPFEVDMKDVIDKTVTALCSHVYEYRALRQGHGPDVRQPTTTREV